MDALLFFRRGAIAAVGLAAIVFGLMVLIGHRADQDGGLPSATPETLNAEALTAKAKAPIVLTPIDQRPLADRYELMAGSQPAQPIGQLVGDAPVLLHFWATWCGPCIPEMPKIDAMAARMGAKLKVIAVSMDRDGVAAAGQFYAQHHLAALAPYGATADSPSPQGLPTSMLLDRHGRVAWIAMGAHPWGDDLDQAVAQLTAEP